MCVQPHRASQSFLWASSFTLAASYAGLLTASWVSLSSSNPLDLWGVFEAPDTQRKGCSWGSKLCQLYHRRHTLEFGGQVSSRSGKCSMPGDGQLGLSFRAHEITLLLHEFPSSIVCLLVPHQWAGCALDHGLGCHV